MRMQRNGAAQPHVGGGGGGSGSGRNVAEANIQFLKRPTNQESWAVCFLRAMCSGSWGRLNFKGEDDAE